MPEAIELLIHFFVSVIKLLKPGGVKVVMAESIALKPHWVMAVLDQYTRRIIRFSVHTGDCDGIAYYRMFNEIISGKSLPEYLSSDNGEALDKNVISIDHYRWKKHCNGLYQLPAAA